MLHHLSNRQCQSIKGLIPLRNAAHFFLLEYSPGLNDSLGLSTSFIMPKILHIHAEISTLPEKNHPLPPSSNIHPPPTSVPLQTYPGHRTQRTLTHLTLQHHPSTSSFNLSWQPFHLNLNLATLPSDNNGPRLQRTRVLPRNLRLPPTLAPPVRRHRRRARLRPRLQQRLLYLNRPCRLNFSARIGCETYHRYTSGHCRG